LGELGMDVPPVNIYLDPKDKESGLVRPYGMGPRVPMYVVSPWSKGGWVSSEVFDHSSVGQFLEKRFGVTVPAISPWNRAVAGDLTSAFDFASPNDPVVPELPETKHALNIEAIQIAMPPAAPPASPQAFVQEQGTRPSRPTPYVLYVSSQVSDSGKVTLRFTNKGQQGAVFHVYDRLHLDRIPRRYTVEAGKTLDDTAWDAADDGGSYDLDVFSTNGFVRTFKGNVKQAGATALDLQLAYDVKGGAVLAQLRNLGTTPVELRIVANEYRNDGPWLVPVAPQATAEQSWKVSDSGNWYDFTISTPGLERRFAGRMENGGNLISDPAMGTS